MDDESRHIITILPKTRRSICTCGQSTSLPFCDDTHAVLNEENGTNYRSLKIENPTESEIELSLSSKNWQEKK